MFISGVLLNSEHTTLSTNRYPIFVQAILPSQERAVQSSCGQSARRSIIKAMEERVWETDRRAGVHLALLSFFLVSSLCQRDRGRPSRKLG